MIRNHRMQKLELDEQGVLRFRKNKIVEFLLEKGPFTLNVLAGMPPDMGVPKEGFPTEDWRQFAQLLGYSVDGYCSLSYVSRAEAHRAEDAERDFLEKRATQGQEKR